jgi:hypothetical protein
VLKLYGGRGYPSAWALDGDGKVIWSGHPAGVTNEMVEKWVENIAPTKVNREVDRSLSKAAKTFDAGEYGQALQEAKDAAAKTEDEAVKADAAYIESLVQKHLDANAAKQAKAKEEGDLVALGKALEEAAAKFKGSEPGNTADAAWKELKKSKEYKDTIAAHNELEAARPLLDDMKPSSARKKLERIAKKYPETKAGKEASELAKRY